jgi:hypothetical protein
MPTSSLDPDALTTRLRAQDGLITLDQARVLGLTPSALSRRLQRPDSGWRRVLPSVYFHGQHDLTDRQKTRAAVLFAGPGAILTGNAALRWHRLRHLPDEVSIDSVDVVTPPGRQLRSQAWARLHRSDRPSGPYLVDGVRTMPVTRAIVDAAGQFPYETLLALVCAAVNEGRSSPDQLRDELAMAPTKGSGGLRRALGELDAGSRSGPEAQACRLFAQAGLPEPLVNVALMVGGRLFVPDFRWGRVILEIDSKAYHLLEPGAWDRTMERRAFLAAHGYLVLPVSPEQLRKAPDEILAAIFSALELHVA